jgi:hypothetical protein
VSSGAANPDAARLLPIPTRINRAHLRRRRP